MKHKMDFLHVLCYILLTLLQLTCFFSRNFPSRGAKSILVQISIVMLIFLLFSDKMVALPLPSECTLEDSSSFSINSGDDFAIQLLASGFLPEEVATP